ncbi:MAG: dihydroorotate dehydrogenase electron transfer subunit [Oscillospiraceae bacterium]|nr:dihydroorotate dehydrogenase electron transfer subunit [Oscillospiraceae bacterium]
MQQGIFTIVSNRPVSGATYEMVLQGDTSAITAPGQFINIKLDGFYLRRPISVCDRNDSTVTILYKALGKGTEAMTAFAPGKELDILTGLGNGFDVSKSGEKPLLVGGGVGVAPMYLLAKELIAAGKSVTAVLGYNNGGDVFYAEKLEELGVRTIVCTADGSIGVPGFVTDGMKEVEDYTYLYTCGPEPMLKAVYDACKTSGDFSFEERMGCGFGACMGCTCETKYGNKRICRDGPVLVKEEIVW